MLGYLRRNHLAIIALVVALGGTGAYAAGKIGSGDIKRHAIKKRHVAKKAIASPQLANGKVKAIDVKDGTLSGIEVANGGLGGIDIGNGTLQGADIANGSLSVADLAIASGREALSSGTIGYGVCDAENVDLGPEDHSKDMMLTTLGPGDPGSAYRVLAQHANDPLDPNADFTIYVCNDADISSSEPLPDYVDWIVLARP